MAQSERTFNENTQSKYRKIRTPNTDQASIAQNEVRITTQGKVKRYVDYAVRLLTGPNKENDEENNSNPNEPERTIPENEKPRPTKQFDTIVLKATGRAIYSAVTTAEVVKRKVAGLHQVTLLNTLEIDDTWAPLEEGLKEVKTKRRVASIEITLSRKVSDVDQNAVGYQEPILAESVPMRNAMTRGRGRGRGRGYYNRGDPTQNRQQMNQGRNDNGNNYNQRRPGGSGGRGRDRNIEKSTI